MTTVSIPSGVQGIPTTSIPLNPAAFPQWFRDVFIPLWLANADVRNAVQGTGISITGNPSTAATISAAENLQALFKAPYLLAVAPTDAYLLDYRVIAAQSGVLTVTDGGVLGHMTVGVAANGIGNIQLRQSAGLSIVGNSSGATANVADIVASTNGQVLGMVGGVLAFTDAIVPTWTGQHTFTPGTNETAIIVNAPANYPGVSVLAGSGLGAIVEVCGDGSGTGNGLSITQTSVGAGLINLNYNAALIFKVNGTNRAGIGASGGLYMASATGGDEGAGTINVGGGYNALYFNGTALGAIVPTWSGAHTFTPGTAVAAVTVNAAASNAGIVINAASAAEGLTINGAASSYAALGLVDGNTGNEFWQLRNGALATGTFDIYDVSAVKSRLSITSTGVLTLGGTYTLALTANASLGGTNTGDQSGANPSGTIGLTAVNGSATTFMRSDGAPALGVGISPTWTGNHIFSAASGVGLIANGLASNYTAEFVANSSSGNSYGLLIKGGTTSADSPFIVQNQGGTVTFCTIYGDGHGYLGASSTTGLSWDASGNVTAANNTTLTTGVTLATTAAHTVGFYGRTPAAQQATTSAHSSSNVVSSSIYNSTANQKMVAVLQEVMNTLYNIGIWADH